MSFITGIQKTYQPTSASSNSTSFASIGFADGTNYLFYYNTENSVAYLSGKDDAVFSNTTLQISPDVTIQAGSISPLAAVGWVADGGKKEIRVYYVEQNTSLVKELCSDDGKSWRSGDFDSKQYKIASGGGLAASHVVNMGLKVYFADANNNGKIVEAHNSKGFWKSNVIQ